MHRLEARPTAQEWATGIDRGLGFRVLGRSVTCICSVMRLVEFMALPGSRRETVLAQFARWAAALGRSLRPGRADWKLSESRMLFSLPFLVPPDPSAWHGAQLDDGSGSAHRAGCPGQCLSLGPKQARVMAARPIPDRTLKGTCLKPPINPGTPSTPHPKQPF